jgi:probable HAF family extracellular repeat protein
MKRQGSRGRRPRLSSLPLLAALLLPAAPVHAQHYRLTVVGPPGSEALAINETGQVAGVRATMPSGGIRRTDAFVWTPVPVPSRGLGVGFHLLPTFGGQAGSATAINDSFQVVGWSEVGGLDPPGLSETHAFLWDENGFAPLLPIHAEWPSSLAYGINEAGEAVGIEGSGFSCRPILWLPAPAYGYPAGANLLPAGPYQDGVLNDINDRGEIAGYVTSACDVIEGGMSLWLPEPAYGLPAGFNLLSEVLLPLSRALAINEHGLAVGVWEDFEAEDNVRAAFWSGDEIEFLEPPGSGLSAAVAVNDAGTILGSLDGDPVMWTGGERFELNDLLPAGSEMRLVRANGINDRGQIAGLGGLGNERFAVVLSPFAFVQFFADGFESGDLGGWDIVFP